MAAPILPGGYPSAEAAEAARDEIFREILQCAVQDDSDRIRQLVRIGCPPSFANKIGQTALHIGSLWGNAGAVRTLLELRANVNAQNRLRGSAPLHVAAEGRGPADKRAECVRLLLEARGDPSLPDGDGCTALELAADGPLREAFGAAPLLLHKAVKAQKLPDLQAALQQVKARAVDLELDATDPDGVTALHLASGSGWRTGLAHLIAAGASVRSQAHGGDTPLHSAVHRGDTLAVKMLVEAKAEVNVRDQDREMGPRFKSKTSDGDPTEHRMPLHWAACYGNVVAVRALLDAGADPNAADSRHQSTLRLALEAREKGSDFELGCGVRIVGTKQERLNGALATIIGSKRTAQSGGPERWPVLVDGHAGEGCLLKEENLVPTASETIALLLEARADPDAGGGVTSESSIALHDAARRGDAELTAMLLAARAAVNVQDGKQGFTALHLAARSNHDAVAALLVAARADLALANSAGLTAADLAKKNHASAGLLAALEGRPPPAPPAPAAAAPTTAGAGAGDGPGGNVKLGDLSAAERAALFLD